MKVLFFHPANYLEISIPQGIAILSAVLKGEGHEVALFDTTFIKPRSYACEQLGMMAGPSIYKKTEYTIEDLVKDDPVKDVIKEFQNKIDEFKPDLLAVSTMTTSYDFAVETLRKLKIKCPVVVGGVHPTISPQEAISEKVFDIVCVGEGEGALSDLCAAMQEGRDYTGIKNLWVKSNGKAHRNPYRPFVDLDALPCPDWSMFDKRHLFRPFVGKIYVGGLYASSRGCPCDCTYCVNRTLREIFQDCGRYFHYQKPETTARHLAEIKEKYGATWFKFVDDTFLLQPVDNLKKLCELVKPLNIQFGCSIRPNTVTEEKVKIVREMGCVAMSVGIETGNEEIRRKVLNRQISNKQIEDAFRIINAYDIRISAFNMVGLPGETRENVFETIEFNRKLNVKSGNVYVVYPFPKSQISMKHKIKYRTKSGKIIPMGEGSVFRLSKMPPKEVEGLKKTFNMYLNLPKELWPVIKYAEQETKQGKKIYSALNDFTATIV